MIEKKKPSLREQLRDDIKVYDKRIAALKSQLDLVPKLTSQLNQNIGAKLQCLETLKRIKESGN